MRSFAICILLFALVGAGLCERLRRQVIGNNPPQGAVPEGISPQGSVDSAKVNGPASAKSNLDAQAAMPGGGAIPAKAIGDGLDGLFNTAE